MRALDSCPEARELGHRVTGDLECRVYLEFEVLEIPIVDEEYEETLGEQRGEAFTASKALSFAGI